ncbi:restriction endonuclease subunit S [Streptomyces mirabilis]|uniref:restriction endonuclease subunit S n=1 Tax=Streptomyces mirabilis TaxID=68239 RepID=UPI0036CEF0FC
MSGRSTTLRAAAEVALGRQRAPQHDSGPHMVPYLRAANVKDGVLDLTDVKEMNFTPTEQQTFSLRPGDVLITEGSGSLRAVGASAVWRGEIDGVVCFQNTLLRLRPRDDRADGRFLEWWARSAFGSGVFASVASGANIYHISAERVRALPIELPPLEEQRRIADFLDAETARIDKLVRLRSEQSTLIGEGIAAEAVDLTGRSHIRRGGGTTENMVQLRRAAMSTQTGSTPADLHELSDGSAPEGNLPWYTPAAINSWMSIATAEKATHRDGAPLFPAGSVVITGIGESLGKVAYLNHVATGNQQLTAITPQVGVSGRFMAWQLWAAEQEIREWAQYSRIRIINNDSLKSFPIYLPSRAEQDTVVRTLDSHMVRVRQITDAFLRFQRLADERRQALITAAVTGQFDVSTASGRNVPDGVSA